MGMGKKSAAPAPAQQTATTPTVVTKDIVAAQADDNAAANKEARVNANESATLLQVKDEEELKKTQSLLG